MSRIPVAAERSRRDFSGRRTLALLGAAVAVNLGGCLAVAVVTGVGAVAVATVSTAGKVAGATVVAGGKVVSSAITASSDVADSGVNAAAKLSKTGMVVFFDPKSGAVWQAPWQQGLKLVAASQAAQVGTAYQAARIIRGAQVIAAEKKKAADLLMKSGDVVELTSLAHP